jgi:hypothetical protein
METFGYLVECTMVIYYIHICTYVDSSKSAQLFNDLWKFNGEEWVWMSGSNQADEPGVYGEMGTPDSNNMPGGRYGAVSWMDNSENMWIFGGYGYPADGFAGNEIYANVK